MTLTEDANLVSSVMKEIYAETEKKRQKEE